MQHMSLFSARPLIAAIAVIATVAIASSANAIGGMHYRASEHFGGMHYRASNSCNARSTVVYSSRCRGPVVVTTWTPYPTTGFVFSSRPTILAQPSVFPSSRGLRSSLGGFVSTRPSYNHRGPVHCYNGSLGSNNAQQRKINWEKRARVHSPRLADD